MNRDIGGILRPLFALVLFVLVLAQTVGALRTSGVWSRVVRNAAAPANDPLAALESALGGRTPAPSDAPMRDPFEIGAPPAPVTPVGRPRVVVPPPPEVPVLTAIVWDSDPRAVVHWKDRDWTVRAGGLFDEFQVLGITRDQVTLARGTGTVVLQRKSRGE